MITANDIYAATNNLLKSKYSTAKTPGHETKQGYTKPSFFVDIRPKKISNESVNVISYAYTIQITYFPKTIDETDNMAKANEIQFLFGHHLAVKDRKLLITDFDYEFVGEKTDILQISIDIEFYDDVERTETHETMKTLEFNEVKE